jgi:hypothetical protein
MIPHTTALQDPRLTATVLARTPLFYRLGPNPATDRPEQVRAGSSLTWFRERLAVIQDDACFVALIDPELGAVDALRLPPGERGVRQFDDRRGNKAFKPDYEACAVLPWGQDAALLAFGSGSSNWRESVAVIDAATGESRIYAAAGLYARLRETQAFSGSELNIEGAYFAHGRVYLFNRGNGAVRDGLLPRDASCELEAAELEAYLLNPDKRPVPTLANIRQYDLGRLDGNQLTFTDAMAMDQGFLYVAAAEDSPDAVSDGQVTGSAVGVMDNSGRCRWTELREPHGGLFPAKVEGVCAVPGREDRLYVVIDEDDPDRPSELCEIALSGPWF